MNNIRQILFTVIVLCSCMLIAQQKYFEERDIFPAPEAKQAVAVDNNYVYVIADNQIAKYNKQNFQLAERWISNDTTRIIHLDSGLINNGKLFCAHSNYPKIPNTSSIEIWDATNLQHIDSHSFGILWGWCTWIDRLDNNWFVGFANYNKWKHISGKGTEWTTVVKYDDNWNFIESWIFPDTLIQMFGEMSNSGGSFGPEGLLYCTGHDNPELYVLKFHQSGSTLELVEIIPIGISGQGIAWYRNQPNLIYGIKREEKLVTAFELITVKRLLK